MRLRELALVPLVLGVAAAPAAATSIDFNLSGESAKLSFIQPLEPEGLEVGGGWLHHEDDGDLLEAELHLVDDANPRRGALELGVGGKLVAVSDDERDADGGALTIGGKFRYTWPNFNRFGIGGHAYYAPGATSASDIDGYQEFALRAEYLVLRNASAYIGYRDIELDYDGRRFGSDRSFDDGFYAGVRISF